MGKDEACVIIKNMSLYDSINIGKINIAIIVLIIALGLMAVGGFFIALAFSFRKQLKQKIRETTKAKETAELCEVKTKARTKELKELAHGLRIKAEQKTKELQERVSQLEKFHRLTVGRELRMIEIKQALKAAQYELSVLKTKQSKSKIQLVEAKTKTNKGKSKK